MLVKVFVLGRPGSGKSTAIRRIIELANRRGYSTAHMRDYDILFDMFKKDVEHGKFSPAEHGGFDVINFSVLDTALELLQKQVQEQERASSGRNEVVMIEFARDDYNEALSKFTPDFLNDAYFLFIEAGLETCIERISRRVANPLEPDHHFVSYRIMKNYYRKDNRPRIMYDEGTKPYIVYNFQEQYHILRNVELIDNSDSLKAFEMRVSDFAEMIFKKEFYGRPTPLKDVSLKEDAREVSPDCSNLPLNPPESILEKDACEEVPIR